MNENRTSVNSHVCITHVGGALCITARVRERSDATCSVRPQGDASRPPAPERLPLARPAALAPPATHRLHRRHARLHHHALAASAGELGSRTARDRCILRGACGDRGGVTHRGGPVLRAASRICLAGFLLRAPQPPSAEPPRRDAP